MDAPLFNLDNLFDCALATPWVDCPEFRALHEQTYATAYITQAMLNMDEVVDAYSYWTFSDPFEENVFPAKPLQGGFRLMNVEGTSKPAWRAHEILQGFKGG